MLAEQYLRKGHLIEALSALQAQVKAEPANARYRVFLFQLLAVLGQWERALNQLKVASELDAANLLMAQTYREAIHCEKLREAVFAGKHTPVVFGDPQAWGALMIEALRLDAQEHIQEAKALREQALNAAPARAGCIDGVAFEWMADADGRLGPLMEAIVNGKYYWVPLQQILKIELEQPSDLRDVVWTPAVFTWNNGGQASGLIPTRYPDSEKSADTAIQMGLKTEWQELANGVCRGLGQRLLATDVDDYALMDTRLIEFNRVAR